MTKKKKQGHNKALKITTMYPKSDVTVDASKFDRDGIDKQTLEFNEKLIKIWADGPRWYEVCPIPSNPHPPIPLAIPHPSSPSLISFNPVLM